MNNIFPIIGILIILKEEKKVKKENLFENSLFWISPSICWIFILEDGEEGNKKNIKKKFKKNREDDINAGK